MLCWWDDTGPHVRRSSHDRIPSLTEAVAAAYPRYDVVTPEHWPLDPYLNGPLGPVVAAAARGATAIRSACAGPVTESNRDER